MPNTADEEPFLAAGEAEPAPVSIPDDLVSKVNEQLEMAKLSDQDEARPPADATVGTTNPKEDPELWKPHPLTEECPVCLVPLYLENAKHRYWVCCGKMLCKACSEEHNRALHVTNRKREKKKLPPMEQTCAFCRSPVEKNDAELIRRYEERIQKDDTQAMVNLAYKFRIGSNGLRQNDEKALKMLQRAADLGSAVAIGMLGYLAANSWRDSVSDRRKVKECLEDATKKGDVPCRHNLALVLLMEEDTYDLAIKHLHLAAAAGYDDSMKSLWDCFSKGKLSKPDLEKALRAHKAASDEMSSEERERYDAWKDAEAGNDEGLKIIYNCYYAGCINAKELKNALKAYRAGDWRAVDTLVESKAAALALQHA